MSFKLSHRDLRLLEQYRLYRLRQLFTKTLGLCILRLDAESTLMIHCPEPWLVDRLMDDLDHLLGSARIILGARLLSIHYAGEEVCKQKTCKWENSMPAK